MNRDCVAEILFGAESRSRTSSRNAVLEISLHVAEPYSTIGRLIRSSYPRSRALLSGSAMTRGHNYEPCPERHRFWALQAFVRLRLCDYRHLYFLPVRRMKFRSTRGKRHTLTQILGRKMLGGVPAFTDIPDSTGGPKPVGVGGGEITTTSRVGALREIRLAGNNRDA